MEDIRAKISFENPLANKALLLYKLSLFFCQPSPDKSFKMKKFENDRHFDRHLEIWKQNGKVKHELTQKADMSYAEHGNVVWRHQGWWLWAVPRLNQSWGYCVRELLSFFLNYAWCHFALTKRKNGFFSLGLLSRLWSTFCSRRMELADEVDKRYCQIGLLTGKQN